MEKKHPGKLLIVESNPDRILIIRGVLDLWAKDHQSQIDFVSSVAEAVAKISAAPFDVILTASRLADKTGFDLLIEIRNRNMRTPVLLMISEGDDQSALGVLRFGFADCISDSDGSFTGLTHSIETAHERFVTRGREKKVLDELAAKNVQLRSANAKIAEISTRDELTGLYNHRFFQEKAAEEFARSMRYHYPLSCLIVDIDYFKNINDTYGHSAGDEVLHALAQFFTSHLRQADTIARYGGEEFAILLPYTTYDGAYLMADRLRKKIMDMTFLGGSHPSLKISVSIGVASYPEDPVDGKDMLLFYADKALYRAKGGGRNRVYLYRTMTVDAEKIPDLKFRTDKVAEFRRRLFDVSEMAKRAYIEATKALINALEAKDAHTMGHAARVGNYSALVAREMGLKEDEVRIIEHGGLLHDIGKICISDDILLKPGVYTPEEYEKMKAHPVLGYQIVKPIKFLAEEALVVLYHHEWYNGEGYPYGLKDKEIPIGARIVSVLDAYDTMRVAGGRYKRTLNCEEAVRELIKYAGTQFDPKVVLHLVHALLKRNDLEADAYDRAELERSLKMLAA